MYDTVHECKIQCEWIIITQTRDTWSSDKSRTIPVQDLSNDEIWMWDKAMVLDGKDNSKVIGILCTPG